MYKWIIRERKGENDHNFSLKPKSEKEADFCAWNWSGSVTEDCIKKDQLL